MYKKALMLTVGDIQSFAVFLLSLCIQISYFSAPESQSETTNGSSGLVQSLEGGVVTKRSSRIAGLKKDESMVFFCNLL